MVNKTSSCAQGQIPWVLAPNAALRVAVMSSAGPPGATLQLLKQARQGMGLAAPSTDPDEAEPKPDFRRNLARS